MLLMIEISSRRTKNTNKYYLFTFLHRSFRFVFIRVRIGIGGTYRPIKSCLVIGKPSNNRNPFDTVIVDKITSKKIKYFQFIILFVIEVPQIDKC